MGKVEDGSFKRKYPMERLNNIKSSEQDSGKLRKIYHAWYRLPRSSGDFDAFVANYSKLPHEAIAKRLISPAAATIEHIRPQSRNGDDSMRNYLLVCSQLNSERSSMPLDEFIMLNSELDIPRHLQEYTDSVIDEISIRDSLMSLRSWYPEAIQKTLLEETNGYVLLDISKLKLSKDQIKENNFPEKLSKKYTVIQK